LRQSAHFVKTLKEKTTACRHGSSVRHQTQSRIRRRQSNSPTFPSRSTGRQRWTGNGLEDL